MKIMYIIEACLVNICKTDLTSDGKKSQKSWFFF